MSKMGSNDPFGYLKHKLWPKERSRVKLPIWLPTTKSQELPDFFVCRWHTTYRWKALDDYNVALDLTSIGGLHIKLWACKVAGVPILEISGLPLGKVGVPRQNDIWVLVLWLGIYNTIRGKVVVSPKYRPWWVLWVHVCLWRVRAPKVL
jgi:hypothetical protein